MIVYRAMTNTFPSPYPYYLKDYNYTGIIGHWNCSFNGIKHIKILLKVKYSRKRETIKLVILVMFNNFRHRCFFVPDKIYYYKFYYNKPCNFHKFNRTIFSISWTKNEYKNLYHYKSFYTYITPKISMNYSVKNRITEYPFCIFIKKRIERIRKHNNILNCMDKWLYRPKVGPGFWDCYNKLLKDTGNYETYVLLNEINKAKSKLKNNGHRLLSYAPILEV
jgi:hypothetical protein